MRVGAATRVYALLGDPVAHSLSPRMHNAAFVSLGLDAVYVALRCGVERVAPLMRSLAEAGGGGNVTVPHKVAAAAAVDQRRGPVPDACNTFFPDGGRLVGDNTDVAGVAGALRALGALQADPWLVIGTGGSALAVAAAAAESGVGLAVRSRDPDRAEVFLRRARELGAGEGDASHSQLVINATPLGLHPEDALPVQPTEVAVARWALDLVYAAGETPWVRAMRAAGVAAADGREVLVEQGAAGFERWFPGKGAPREVMRAAVRAGLG